MESVVIVSAQQAGFTLIELMIVIVLVAIFITVGVPSFQNLVSDNRLSTQANRLVSSLQLARTEALKLGAPVSICRTTDGASCAGVGTTWETGWLVFVDTNANGDVDGERIILANSTLSGGNTLRAAAPFNDFVNYQPNGLQSAANGTFRICDGNNPDINKGRNIAVSPTGSITTTISVASCT